MGIKTIDAKLDRGGLNPLKDFAYFLQLHKIYRSEKPDLVHHVTLIPCLYGSIAASTRGVKNVVKVIAGLGSIVTSKSFKIRLVRPFIMTALRILFVRRNSELILRNEDDVKELTSALKLRSSGIHLTRESGVDTEQFQSIHPSRYHLLRYKDLVTAPEVTLQSLGGFLGLDLKALSEAVAGGESIPKTAQVSGNRLRKDVTVTLKRTDENQAVSYDCNRLFLMIIYPILRRYEYL